VVIDRDRLSKLHARLLTGDVTATSELFQLAHRALTRVVRSRQDRRLEWDDASDAATDAILSYAAEPGRFDPAQASLFGYLTLIANRDALNLLRKRRGNDRKHEAFVEHDAHGGKDTQWQPNARMDATRILEEHYDTIVQEAGDEHVLELYLLGERDTDAYAIKLGISDLDVAEKQRIVKQRRDRVEQRLRRLKEALK
jgi:DNA-directed RNA polymerase specialized sigma24 family protein